MVVHYEYHLCNCFVEIKSILFYVVAINVVFMRNVDSYCVRVGSLNVGTVTGKGGSLADMMETRHVGLLCV